MENKRDKLAPENTQELDHWHVPQNLIIKEDYTIQDSENKNLHNS